MSALPANGKSFSRFCRTCASRAGRPGNSPLVTFGGLAKFLQEESATHELVREFNATMGARMLVEQAVERLAAAINSRTEHTPREVAEMLGVTQATVTGWMREGYLDSAVLAQGRQRITDSHSLLRFLSWQSSL